MQAEFTPGGAVRVLAKNPNHWKAGRPKASALNHRGPGPVAAISAIRSGEVDL
jgi:hypothetical protein